MVQEDLPPLSPSKPGMPAMMFCASENAVSNFRRTQLVKDALEAETKSDYR